jgi:hypothetical protein
MAGRWTGIAFARLSFGGGVDGSAPAVGLAMTTTVAATRTAARNTLATLYRYPRRFKVRTLPLHLRSLISTTPRLRPKPDNSAGGTACGVRKYDLAAKGQIRTADEFTHPTGYPETYPLTSWTTLHLSKGLSHISKCGDPFSGTRDVVLRFQQGDHLRVRRRLGYFHHGIYVDDERCEFDLSAGTMNRHHSGPRTALEDRAVARNCT